MKKSLLFLLAFGLMQITFAQNYQSFRGTASPFTGNNWTASSATNACVAGPYTSSFTSGRIAYFCVANATASGAGGITVGGIIATENLTYSSPSGTLATGGTVISVDVASGKTLDLSTLSISTAAGTGFIKNGDGVYAVTGGTFTGGFTVNAGTIMLRGVNAMGAGGALTINGGVIAATATRDLTGKYTGITVGGDFTLGATTGLALSTANLTFSNNMALGTGTTRTITIGGTGNYTLGGIISGTGSNLNISSTAAGTVVLTGANTYSGTTTVNGGTLNLNRSGGTTLPTTNNLVVANGATVLVSTAQQLNNVTVDAGGTLIVAATLTIAGTATINGNFQINQGGFANTTGGGVWTYGSTGKLVYNNTSLYGPVDAGHTYWPVSNGPANVTVQNGGGINMGVARTVPSSGTTGTFLLVTGTNAIQGTALTLNGTTQINGGNFQTTPTYGSSSTLIYNTSYGTSNEWTGGASTSVAAGSGIPANVEVQTGTVTLSGGRGVPGNITVASGAGLTLNASSGDLYLGGNLSNSGTWTNNGRAVAFVLTGTSTVTASSGTQFFDYLLVNKSAGSVQLATGTNSTINSTSGDVLQMLNAGTLDLNGNTLTLNNAGGNILASGGARSITSSVSGGLVNITAAKTVTTASSGTVSFGSNVTVATAAAFNPGAALTTINGTFRINAGGSANTNSPIYGSSATLNYNTANYNTSNEWVAGVSVGTGVPFNVTLTLAAGTNAVTLAGSRSVPGTLTLTTGDVVLGGNTITAGTITRTNGNLQGSNTAGVVLSGTGSNLGFDQTSTNNYLKTLTLNTGATAALANALNITGYDGVSSEGVLTVTGTAVLTTGGFLTIKSNANGTARIAANTSGATYISGDVTVERYIPQNTRKGWRLLASTTSGQTINAAWQEGQNNSVSNTTPGFGTKITAGSSVTTNLTTAHNAGFDTLSLGTGLHKYNATTDALEPVMATNTGDIASEHGYFIFIRGDRRTETGEFTSSSAPTAATVLRSKGTLFLGNQSAVTTGALNYALVRNPYPSRIDVNQIVRTGTLVNAFQVWDAKLNGTYGFGGFQTIQWDNVDSRYEVTPGGGSYGAANSAMSFIESGAAFYIQSASAASGTAQVVEGAKAGTSTTNSFRPATPSSTIQRINFTLLTNNTTGGEDVVDGGRAYFAEDFSNAIDMDDVRKSYNFNENFGLKRDNIDLVVERKTLANVNDTLFFSMSGLRNTTYKLDLTGLNFDAVLTTAILQDSYTNTNTAIDLAAANSYSFTVDANAASRAANRFRLVFRQSVVVPVSFVSVKAAQSGSNISVEWKVANEVNTVRYEVEKSTDGRNFIKKGSVIASGIGNYSWIDENVLNGYNYYRVKSVDNNGQVKYTQVVKVQTGGKAGIVVSPNPLQGNYLNLQFTGLAAGKYGIRLTNIAGQVVYNKEVIHNGGSASQSFVLSSNLASGIYQLEVINPANERHIEKLVIN